MRMRAAMAVAVGAVTMGLMSIAPAGSRPVLFAQEGHPLTGTWTGEWQRPAGAPTHLTVVMSWDGKAVTGLANPGPDAIPLTAVVDWAAWTVRIDGERKGADPVSVSAEGRLEEAGSPRRRIAGTWTQGGVAGALMLTRE